MKHWLRTAPRWFVRATALIVGLLTTTVLALTLWALSPEARKPRNQAITRMLLSVLKVQGRLGSVRAQLAVAEAYDQGRVVPHDRVKATDWYRRAARNGDAGAQYVLGDRFYRSADAAERAEGLSWWTKAAEAGHINAQEQLAHLYSRVRPQPAEAVKWWRRLVAATGDKSASEHLALALHMGWGVTRNQQEALAIWRELAKRYSLQAHYYLGKAAAEGDGVPQDEAEAVRLWLKHVERPNYLPKRSLALCRAYADGRGVARDPVEATRWCMPFAQGVDDRPMTPEGEAAARSLATASITVISIVEHRRVSEEGLAVLRSLVPDLRTRAASGDAKAQYFLGEALRHRGWTACDTHEAMKWFTRAAAQGDERAAAIVANPKKSSLPHCLGRADPATR